MSEANTNTHESIIESLRSYFLSCPLLTKERLCVDSAQQRQNAYSIGTMMSDEVMRMYLGKSSKRQYVFELLAFYTVADTEAQNAQNAAFFEHFAQWLDEQNKSGNLPLLPQRCKPIKLEALSGGYLETQNTDTKVYAMQCRLVYFKRAN